MSLFDPGFLFASLVWGSIGLGYFLYGRRQQSWAAMIGGILMIATSYFAGSVWVMSLVELALVAGVYHLVKRGY